MYVQKLIIDACDVKCSADMDPSYTGYFIDNLQTRNFEIN